MKTRIAWTVALLSGGLSTALRAQVIVTPPASVRAGDMAKIEWTGLPRGVEELELLLSVDGRDLPVRVTPQLVAGAGVFVWRVPNFAFRRARMRLRFGLDGGEIESPSSPAFEIVPAASEPPAVLTLRDGEWWAERPADPFRGSLEPVGEGRRVEENREGPPCAAASSLAAQEKATARGGEPVVAAPEASAVRRLLPRRPMEVPARL